MFKALIIAFSTYSKLPMPQVEWSQQNMRYAVCFFPMVGVAAGGLLLGWCWLCQLLALTPALRAAGGVVIPLLVSGGIHMDGWCDTADALAMAITFCHTSANQLSCLSVRRIGPI